MGERTSYETGTISWVDLGTTDQERAKAFYAGLFGWDSEDMPIGDGATYTMCRLEGKDVAAIATQNDQERQQGIPPHWNSATSPPMTSTSARRGSVSWAEI